MPHVTLIQMGDLHGHLLPRPNVRGDGTGRLQGGLARMATLVNRIRAERPVNVLANAGDTIQGSAEALFTRGQALVDVVDRLGVDVFAPGNWDYLYGKERFLQLFGPGTGTGVSGTRWGALASNVYHADSDDLLLPPCAVLRVGGLRIGFIGLSSERAINALGPWVTEGITFTSDAHEVPGHVRALREVEGVDLVVLVSEFGLAKNVLIAEQNPGIDVVLSSDMHEETQECVVASTGALVSEVGQDGTRLAQLDLVVEGGRVTSWTYQLHVVDSDLPEDPEVERLVHQVRRPFVSGPGFRPHTNPLNGAVLDRPIDTVVGETLIALHRSGFAHSAAPAAVHGTSHDFISGAFRAVAATDVGHLRGFRYGTHVAPGPVRLEDLYHYLPVGAQLATASMTGAELRAALESSADGTFNPDPFAWTGGWVHSFAGLRYDLDVHQAKGRRITNVEVRRHGQAHWSALEPGAAYTVAGFFFPQTADRVGGMQPSSAVTVLGGHDAPTDVTEHVVSYLATTVVEPEPTRIRLLHPLPAALWGNPEIQPLRGATNSSPMPAEPRSS